jgi:threonyl-tRNA synthetase
VRDVIGRTWQLGTVQLDYVLPERFDLHYVGPDNRPHRPVMIHRAPFGSMERFMGILIEHFGGAFPLWLAPIQVMVLSISEKVADYAKRVQQDLVKAGFRAEVDLGPEKINAKIRNATIAKTPFMLILGEKEQADQTVTVRPYFDVLGSLKGAMTQEDFIQEVADRVRTRWHPSAPPAAGEAPAAS